MGGRGPASGPCRACGSPSAGLPSVAGGSSLPPSVQGRHSGVDVRAEPPVDGALRVDAVKADPDRLEFAALGGAADRVWVQTEDLGELARLVVPLDHRRRVSRVRLAGISNTIEPQSQVV